MRFVITVIAVVLTALAVGAQTPKSAKPKAIYLDRLPSDTRICVGIPAGDTCEDAPDVAAKIVANGRDDCPE